MIEDVLNETRTRGSGVLTDDASRSNQQERGARTAPGNGLSVAQPAALLQSLEDMYRIFEEVHKEYLGAFQGYRETIKSTREAIGPDHPVLDAIRSDHLFTGSVRAKLVALTETYEHEELRGFTESVRTYLTGISDKGTYFPQQLNARRMNFLADLEHLFRGSTKMYNALLAFDRGRLTKNARRQRGRAASKDPYAAGLLSGDGRVTDEQARLTTQQRVVAMLDAVVQGIQIQYSHVIRAYLETRKALS